MFRGQRQFYLKHSWMEREAIADFIYRLQRNCIECCFGLAVFGLAVFRLRKFIYPSWVLNCAGEKFLFLYLAQI
ncbi:MAG TPA: hypothetical protein V6C65_31270 [Allocoleopsis sp.]